MRTKTRASARQHKEEREINERDTYELTDVGNVDDADNDTAANAFDGEVMVARVGAGAVEMRGATSGIKDEERSFFRG